MEKIEKNEEKELNEVKKVNINGDSEAKNSTNNDSNDIPSRSVKANAEERDTTGDTKVFQVIRREDIEREKRRQAINAENATENNKVNANKPTAINETKDNKQIMVVKSEEKAVKPIKPKEKLESSRIDTNTDKEKNKSIKGLLVVLILLLFILVAIVASTIFGIINMNSDKIVSGVNIHNIDVSNLTREEAIKKLNNTINNSETNYVTVKHGEYATEIHLTDIQGNFDTELAVNSAFNVGRDGNIIEDNYNTIKSMLKGTSVDVGFTYNQDALQKKINEISLQIPDLATDSSYVIMDNKVVIKNSKDGVVIKKDEFTQKLVTAFTSGEKIFELPVEKVEKTDIDIESIHDEVYKAPINASYTTNPYQIFKEEDGVDFAMSIDQVKKMLSENKNEFEIELVTVKPQVTVADLDAGAFPDTLATFTTTYGTADTGRNTNIAIAARSINNAIVMPGEEFSYNDLIGECSAKTGYKESTIYLNGELSTGIGGGICQVSTTLYNAVLRANLEIVQRRNHSMGVTYVPAGQDAMVNIGTSDFKFKNNRDYPVKVVAYVGTGSVTCEIHGMKQDTEYEVKLESRTIEKNETRYKVETYKVLYLDGNVVSRTWLSTDTYKYH